MSRPIHNFTAISAAARQMPDLRSIDLDCRHGLEELDLAQRLVGSIRESGEIRREKVQRLRTAIRGQDYENDLKLSVAVDRLLEKMEIAADC